MKYVHICIHTYILGVAWYTDVMVRYVPRSSQFDTISVQQEKKKISTMLGFFSYILN